MTETPAPSPKPFYDREGDAFIPTGRCTSPWDRRMQNGVALGLLMSHTLESQLDGAHLARLTLDILRPAPMGPTRVTWRPVHEGRRVRLLQGELISEGVVGARANALLVAPSPPFPVAQAQTPPLVMPEQASDESVLARKTGLDTRLIQRGKESPDAPRVTHSLWVEVAADITPGVRASPLCTSIAAADFGGSSLNHMHADWTSPNMDITAHFARAPRGPWIMTEIDPMLLGAGVAVINHRLSDRDGEFGRGHQTLFFTRRPKGAAA